MSNKKQFAVFFLVSFCIFVLAIMPVRFALGKASEVRLFGGEESLMDGMEYMVDKSGPYYSLFSKSQRVNILVLGDNDHLTDTIMLASYDMKNQKLDVISIPRDTYYMRKNYKGAAAQKINAIYGSEGVIGTAKAVSDTLLGMPINYYAVIEFSDVKKIVNEIGGVPMDIPFTMKYDDPYDKPPLHIYIAKGQQTLDGEKAVQFLRYRHGYPEGDIGRIKAQQKFVQSALKQAIGPNLPGVVKLGLKEIDSDITLGIATKIATKAIGLDAESVQTYLIPGGPKTVNGASYWFVDTEKTGDLVEQIYTEAETPEDTAGESQE